MLSHALCLTKNDINSPGCLLWTCAVSPTCCTMPRVHHAASLFSFWAFVDITPQERSQLSERLRDPSYISPYDDRCGVSGPVKAVQRSVCAAAVAAFTRNYSDDFVSVLLASPDPWWEASNKIGALRAHQEPRWVAQASRISCVDAASSAHLLHLYEVSNLSVSAD